MNIFFVNLLLIFLYSIPLLKVHKINIMSNFYIIIVTIQLIFFNGLRHYTIGVDTQRYLRHFYNVNNISNFSSFMEHPNELGYKILQKLVGFIYEDFNFFLLIVAIIIFTCFSFIVKKYSKDYFLSYFLFITLGLYSFTFSGIRQALALSITLLAFHFAYRKNLKLFFLFSLVAVSFHSTAIIILPIYILLNMKFYRIHYFFLFLGYLLFFIFRNPIGYFLTLSYYSDPSILNQYTSTGSIGALSIFILFILVIGFVFSNPFKKTSTRFEHGLFNVIIISFFLQSLSSFSYLFTRLNFYYLIFITIYLPIILAPRKNTNNSVDPKIIGFSKITLKFIIIILFTFYYIYIVNSSDEALLPFKFFWE